MQVTNWSRWSKFYMHDRSCGTAVFTWDHAVIETLLLHEYNRWRKHLLWIPHHCPLVCSSYIVEGWHYTKKNTTMKVGDGYFCWALKLNSECLYKRVWVNKEWLLIIITCTITAILNYRVVIIGWVSHILPICVKTIACSGWCIAT